MKVYTLRVTAVNDLTYRYKVTASSDKQARRMVTLHHNKCALRETDFHVKSVRVIGVGACHPYIWR